MADVRCPLYHFDAPDVDHQFTCDHNHVHNPTTLDNDDDDDEPDNDDGGSGRHFH